MGAGELAREQEGFRHLAVIAEHRDPGGAVRERQRGFEGFRQSLLIAVPGHHPVHHHLDAVLVALVQLGRIIEFHRFPVHHGADVALGMEFSQKLLELSLAVIDHRCQQHQATLAERHDLVHHLAYGLGFQGDVMVRATGFPDPGEQQAEVVVDFGHRADRGARIVGGGLLLDADRRGESLDQVHLRFLHHRKELPGIGGEGLDIAPLTLRVNGVEGQRRLSRSRQPRENDELVPGKVEVYCLEIVRARTANADFFGGHEASGRSGQT